MGRVMFGGWVSHVSFLSVYYPSQICLIFFVLFNQTKDRDLFSFGGVVFLLVWLIFFPSFYFNGQALIFQTSAMGIKAYVEPKGHWQLMQQKQRNSGACTFKTQAVHYGGCFWFLLSSLCFIVDTIITFWALKKGRTCSAVTTLRFDHPAVL